MVDDQWSGLIRHKLSMLRPSELLCLGIVNGIAEIGFKAKRDTLDGACVLSIVPFSDCIPPGTWPKQFDVELLNGSLKVPSLATYALIDCLSLLPPPEPKDGGQ